MKEIAVFFIGLYQKTLSPDHSQWGKNRFPQGYCQFYPSCSEYGRQVFNHHGFLKGTLKSLWRILRCNPFSHGGFDPVEKMGVRGGRGGS